MELDPETGETRPIIEPENKSDELPTLDKKDRKFLENKKSNNFKTYGINTMEFSAANVL